MDASAALFRNKLDATLVRLAGRRDDHTLAEARQWIEQLRQENADAALAVVDRLDPLLDRVNAGGLGRWIVGGLRRYVRDPARQGAFFRLEDPRAIESLYGEAAAIDLQQAQTTLALLLAGLAGRDVVVQARHQAQLNAPALRPILTPTHLMLPDSYTILDGIDRFRLYCAAVAHAVAHLKYSEPARDTRGLKPMGIAVVSGIEDARVEQLLIRQYPGVRQWFLKALAPPVDPGDLTFAGLMNRMDRALADPCYEDANHWVQKARRLFEETRAEHGLDDYPAFRATASILANDLGQMRVRFNPQQYCVPQPWRDDHSFLWDFAPPKTPPSDPLELEAQGLRPEPPPDAPEEPAPQEAPEIELGRYSHPEWDCRVELLRGDWCTVIEKRPAWRLASAPAGEPVRALPALPRRNSRRLSRAHRLRRQWEGDDIDLNAAIEILVDRRLDLSPDARLFMRPGKDLPASSALVLLDLSESANDRVGHTIRSILDVEKEAALMLAASIDPRRERLAIHGFSSNTRAEVNYLRLLDFGMPANDPVALACVQSVQASLSTRMGAALRRATAHLGAELSPRKTIIVVTDGAPSDVDVQDADYLIEDARVAVVEAARADVRCYCVALDPGADDYVRRIFGWKYYRIVDDIAALPRHLADLRMRCVKS
jgi:hypothetical protein